MTERERAEQWLAAQMWHAAVQVNDGEEWAVIARIAADAIERAVIAERRSWVGEGRTDLDPIPWAEAIPKETP